MQDHIPNIYELLPILYRYTVRIPVPFGIIHVHVLVHMHELLLAVVESLLQQVSRCIRLSIQPEAVLRVSDGRGSVALCA